MNFRKSSGIIRNSPRHPHRVMLEIERRAAVTRNVFAACSAGRRVMAHDRYVELERHPLGGFGFSVIGGVDTHLPPMVCALVQNGSAQLNGRVSACVDDLCNRLQNHCMKAFIIQLALSSGTFEWLSSRDFVELFSLPGKITISERRTLCFQTWQSNREEAEKRVNLLTKSIFFPLRLYLPKQKKYKLAANQQFCFSVIKISAGFSVLPVKER